MNIQLALTGAKLANKIKIIIPCSSDVFESNSTAVLRSNSTSNSSDAASLPSKGHFRTDLNKTMTELLFFLSRQGSPFVVNINPYSSFQQSKNLSMDYFLFRPKAHPITDMHKKYKNFFDATIDTLVASLMKAGFGNMDIVVGRMGWPTDGAINATSAIAQSFMKGLVDHLRSKDGSPLRPKKPPLKTYIFSLFDEDLRSIATGNFERHWGIFTFDGQAKYNVDLGQGSKELANARNVDYLPSKWCVVNNNNGDLSNVSASFMSACSSADCTPLSPGGSCFGVSLPGNVSYAFNSYYQQHDQRGDSCDFGGLGLITTVDPSTGDCRFAIGLRASFSPPPRGRQLLWQAIVAIACTLLTFA